MATHRQQLTVDTKTPESCAGSSSPYVVSYTPTAGGGWTQRGNDIDGEAAGDYSGIGVSSSSDGTVVAIGAISNDGGGGPKPDFAANGHVRVYAWNGSAWVQRGADIDGEAGNDYTGQSVSLSSDGSIVAIGAWGNDKEVGTNTGPDAGSVRVYEYKTITEQEYNDGNTANTTGASGVPIIIDGGVSWGASTKFWVQQGDDIIGAVAGDYSGRSVSLSSDGMMVAIGARGHESNRGIVRVYSFRYGSWDQKGADLEGYTWGDWSGHSVSLVRDGTVWGAVVAIGAPFYRPGYGMDDAGHVRVYGWVGGGSGWWTQKGADIVGEAAGDWSGESVSLGSDGNIVAIGAIKNDGTGEVDQVFGANTGHVRVYDYDGNREILQQWSQIGADIDGEVDGEMGGNSVSLSSDGTIVAIGSLRNDGDTGNANDNRGHVRVYEYKTITEDEYDNGNTANTIGAAGVPIIIDGGVSWGASTKFWVQYGDDIDGEAAGDLSGRSISLSSDGTTVVIGAPYNDGTGSNAGHVRVYQTGSPSDKSPQVGDWAVVEHKEEATGASLSTYTYRITYILNSDTLVLEFVSATGGYTDDSPCDLCDGTGSVGVCGGIAPNVIKRDLGGMFMLLLD